MWGSHVDDREESLQRSICIFIRMQMGSNYFYTYSVVLLWEAKNCNGTLQNTQIVIVFLQNSKITIE